MKKNKIPSLIKCLVIANHGIAPGVNLLRFLPHIPFIAGQMVNISIEEKGVKRLYSLASGINDPYMEILFDVKPSGMLTPQLSQLRIGSELYCSEPHGTFKPSDEPAWWIASGTGIAPFRSMLRSGYEAGITLVHGGRYLHSFYFEDEFVKSKMRYIRCCSQERSAEVYPGRLTQFLRQTELPRTGIRYYLCGSAEMVVDTRDLLISKGVSFEAIVSEIYF